jgi:hypothetical protein
VQSKQVLPYLLLIFKIMAVIIYETIPNITASAVWGGITGDPSDQTDLMTLLGGKFNNPTGTTSQYLRGDGSTATFPTIPTVPTNVSAFTNDANYLTNVSWSIISDKPTFATVATSGSYNDLSNKPAIPTKERGVIGITIPIPSVTSKIIFTAPFAMTLLAFNNIKTVSGTATLIIKINGTAVTGLNSISVTSTPQDITVSGGAAITSGQDVSYQITAISSPIDLTGTLSFEAAF